MEEKVLLKVAYDENGQTVVNIPDSGEAIFAVCNYVLGNLVQKKREPLDVLFSVVVHFLAMDISGNFEKQFIKNIRETTPTYREGYRMMRQQLSKPKN